MFTHRTVVLEHSDTKSVRTGRDSHITDIRIHGVSLHPRVVIAFKTIDESRAILHAAIIR